MKGFYWGSGVVKCSFCGGRGHNITTCQAVNYHAQNALYKIEADNSYVCSKHEHRALVELSRREQRKAKIRKPRKKSACSFCKSLHHKRPKCEKLKDFKQLVYRANKNWKLIFTERANKVGVGVGSLIRFDHKTVHDLAFNVDPNNRIAMITDYDFANLNVFCSLNGYSPYQSNTTIQILSGDKVDKVSVKYLSGLLGSNLLNIGWWYSSDLEIISPMRFDPDPDWLESEWDEVLNWFFDHINELNLNDSGVMQFIKDWANKI